MSHYRFRRLTEPGEIASIGAVACGLTIVGGSVAGMVGAFIGTGIGILLGAYIVVRY